MSFLHHWVSIGFKKLKSRVRKEDKWVLRWMISLRDCRVTWKAEGGLYLRPLGVVTKASGFNLLRVSKTESDLVLSNFGRVRLFQKAFPCVRECVHVRVCVYLVSQRKISCLFDAVCLLAHQLHESRDHEYLGHLCVASIEYR